MERSLEQRIIDLLEPAVGAGRGRRQGDRGVRQQPTSRPPPTPTTPISTAVRSEHKIERADQQEGPGAAGVAGAAANQPGAGVPGGGGDATAGMTQREDETRNYEITKTVTHTVARGPRLKRLSVAVLLDAPGGKPRADAEHQAARGAGEERGRLRRQARRSVRDLEHARSPASSAADGDGIKEMLVDLAARLPHRRDPGRLRAASS